MSKEYWNNVYDTIDINKRKGDVWLEKHNELLLESIDVPILDIGCGLGNDTLYLIDRGYDVISCDFSKVALSKLVLLNNRVKTKCIDINDKLPFKNSSTKIIISDLSLHYFSWFDTTNILLEFSRVLDDQGKLFCRVNSTNDFNHGAGKGIELEKNFYENNGKTKRFFDEIHIRELFKDWNIMYINETQISRYKYDKIAWEVIISKR